MTPKQIDRLKRKIADVRRTLAAEKRKFGGYDDSRGLRYLPTKYYVKLGDYSSGLTYIKWFDKNFPDDGGFPDFLFECVIILFKNSNIQKAEKLTYETFCSNTYLFDKFFGRQIKQIEKWECSNLAAPSFTPYFEYTNSQSELSDFNDWLSEFTSSVKFLEFSKEFIELNKRLNITNDKTARLSIIMHLRKLQESI